MRRCWVLLLAGCSPDPTVPCQVVCEDGFGGDTFQVQAETVDEAQDECVDAYVGRPEGCPTGIDVQFCSCYDPDSADTGRRSTP